MSEQKKMDAERAAFEAWRLEKFCGGAERLKKCSNAPDVYYYSAEQEAWKVWQARASLPVGVPDGYALVPVEPTEAMAVAGRQFSECGIQGNAVFCYRAMLAAAPTVKAEQVQCTTPSGNVCPGDGVGPCKACPSLPAAGSADQPYPDGIAEDLERSEWTPLEALQWYAAGKHFDVVGSRTRIIDTGAVASNALKHASLEYLELKGDAELSELRAALSAQAAGSVGAECLAGQVCGGDAEHNTVNVKLDLPAPWSSLRIGTRLHLSAQQSAPERMSVQRELLERAVKDEQPWPKLDRNHACVGCGNWMPKGHPEAHEHEEDCEEARTAKARHWRSELRALLNGGGV